MSDDDNSPNDDGDMGWLVANLFFWAVIVLGAIPLSLAVLIIVAIIHTFVFK